MLLGLHTKLLANQLKHTDSDTKEILIYFVGKYTSVAQDSINRNQLKLAMIPKRQS